MKQMKQILTVLAFSLLHVGCGSPAYFDEVNGGATYGGSSDSIQKWWNCYIDSNTTYDNTEYGEILWLADGDNAQEAAERALPIITDVIRSGLRSGSIKMEHPGEELKVRVLVCEPN